MKQHSQKLLSLLLCLAMVLSVFAGMGAPAAAKQTLLQKTFPRERPAVALSPGATATGW